MKKLLLSAIALVSFVTAQAQEGSFEKGDVFISGSVGFSSTSEGDLTDSSFTIAPRVGFFASENFAIGASLGYTSVKEEFFNGIDIDEDKANQFDVNAFGRYYFTPTSKFSVFGEGSVGYTTIDFDQDDVKFNGFGIEVGAGVNYFISEHFALEAFWGAINYQTLKADVDGAEADNDFGIGVNLDDITLGLVYKF